MRTDLRSLRIEEIKDNHAVRSSLYSNAFHAARDHAPCQAFGTTAVESSPAADLAWGEYDSLAS